MTHPNPTNFCGGNFQDWLEVNLLPQCNAKCTWCIEKGGFRPTYRATWEEMRDAIIATGKKNVILLGGEPTLYRDLQKLILALSAEDRNVYLTTNGSRLTPQFVRDNLQELTGINVSVHHYDLRRNQAITGILLDEWTFQAALDESRSLIRLNCNLIQGEIDTYEKVRSYLDWARSLGIESVRFAELKGEDGGFVNMLDIFPDSIPLSHDPFTEGCWREITIDGMAVNLRQMCGLQTPARPKPDNPQQICKEVLYPDGRVYPGWITGDSMTFEQRIMNLVAEGTLTPEDAAALVKQHKEEIWQATRKGVQSGAILTSGSGCQY